MAGDLRYYLQQASMLGPDFWEGYARQVANRKLNESAIMQRGNDGKFHIAAIVDPEGDSARERITSETARRLEGGEDVVVIASPKRIEAVTLIDRTAGIYLYSARNSDALALSQWQRAQGVVTGFQDLSRRARSFQLRFNLLLFFVSLGLVGTAIWFALRFADRQVRPLTDLVSAAREVRKSLTGSRPSSPASPARAVCAPRAPSACARGFWQRARRRCPVVG